MQTIGAKIQLDGEAQFKTGLQNIVQQSKTLAAEMKALSSSFDKNATSQEKARAKMQVLEKQISTQKKYIDTLNQKYDAQKQKLDALGAEYKKVSAEQGENSAEAQKLAQEYTRQETALSKTEETINKAQNALNSMENEMRECGAAIEKADREAQEFAEAERKVQAEAERLKIAKKFEEAGEKIKAAGEKVKKFGDNMAKAGKTLSTHVTAPIVAVGAKGVQAFAEVDKTMQLTNKTMGNGAKEAGVLSDAMKSAAANSTFGMSDAATATLNFARAGLNASQAAAALAPSMNLAAGEGGELDTVSAGLVATINGFHGSFEDAGKYADVFAAACNNSALDVNSLSSAMSVAAPIFASAGYSVNDAALYMGVMANNGIEADKAANSLKTGIARLVSPAKEGAEMMKQLGISVTNSDGSMKDSVTIQKELHDAFSKLSESEQIAAASAIFGKNQMAPWLALINTAPEDVNKLNTSLDKCAGTTDEMSDAMMKGFGGSLEKLKSTLDVLVTTIGERLAPHISKFTDKIQDLADKFNALSPEMQDKIIKFAAIAAAIGPVLLVTGKLTAAIGSIMTVGGKLAIGLSNFPGGLNKIGSAISQVGTVFKAVGTAIMAHPVIAIAAVIAGIIAYLVHLYKTNEEFRDKVNAVLDSLKEKWEAFKEGFDNVIEAIKLKLQEWHDKFAMIKEAIAYIIVSIATTIHDKIETMKQAFQSFKDKVQAIVDAVKQKFENLKQSVVNVADKIRDKFNNMKDGINSAIENVKTKIQSLADKVLHVKDKISEYIDKIKDFFKNLVLKIPKPSLPKLPQFEVTWTTKSFLGQDISIPHVGINWYDKGGIFSHPSIIGVGEKRPEFVGALDDLRKIVREESGGTVTINVYGAEGQDVRQLANIVMDKINTHMRRESGAFA